MIPDDKENTRLVLPKPRGLYLALLAAALLCVLIFIQTLSFAPALVIFLLFTMALFFRSYEKRVNLYTQFLNSAQQQQSDSMLLNQIQEITNKLPIGILFFDDQGRCVFHNENMAQTGLLNVDDPQKRLAEMLDSKFYQYFRDELASTENNPNKAKSRIFEYHNRFNREKVVEVTIFAPLHYGEVSGDSSQVEENHEETTHHKPTATHKRNESTQANLGILIARDITEAHESTSQLTTLNDELRHQTQIAVAHSQAKSQFLANMSHEIRTPMNGFLGMLQLLQATELNETQTKYANTMMQSAESLLKILNDILDLSKLESGKLTFESELFDVHLMLKQVVQTYVDDAKIKGLSISSDITEDVPTSLIGDECRITQIINNLVSNAIKFTSKGSVHISIELVQADDTNAIIEFRVKDTGIGMNDEQQRRVFGNFEQADNTTTRQFGGTGLGLAISRDLATRMKGQLGVSSAPNRGSEFWLLIPLIIGSDIQLQAPSSTVIHEKKHAYANISSLDLLKDKRILVVDDNEINRVVAGNMLEEYEVEVSYATNGEEALKTIHNNRFDLVLMDYQMPVMDGVEATRIIRKTNSQMPIIAMTAAGFDEDIDSYYTVGMNGVVLKPFQLEQLIAEVKKHLRVK